MQKLCFDRIRCDQNESLDGGIEERNGAGARAGWEEKSTVDQRWTTTTLREFELACIGESRRGACHLAGLLWSVGSVFHIRRSDWGFSFPGEFSRTVVETFFFCLSVNWLVSELRITVML